MLDFQVDVCEVGGKMVSQDPGVLDAFKVARSNMAAVLEAVRQSSDGPVPLHVTHVYQDGYPELASARLSAMEDYVRKMGAFIEGTAGAAVVPELTPLDNETVIRKHTLSPFASTGLAWQLKKRNISTVILAGVVTHYAILSTAFSAYDAGYSVVVLEDCCMSGTQDTHRVALEILEPIATLVKGADIIRQLSSPGR